MRYTTPPGHGTAGPKWKSCPLTHTADSYNVDAMIAAALNVLLLRALTAWLLLCVVDPDRQTHFLGHHTLPPEAFGIESIISSACVSRLHRWERCSRWKGNSQDPGNIPG